MRLLAFGPRTWNDRRLAEAVLEGLLLGILRRGEALTVIEGGARGLDRIAGEVALRCGCELLRFDAEWDRYGNAAGAIRNRRMLDEGRPDQAVGFVHGLVDGLPNTPGSRHMATLLVAAKLPLFYVVAPPLRTPPPVGYVDPR